MANADNSSTTTRRKAPSAKKEAPVVVDAAVPAPRLTEPAVGDAKAAKSSLREGGLVASKSELLFMLGNVPLVVDKDVLAMAIAAMRESDDPGLWFGANQELVHSIVFVPSAPRIAKAFPLLSVRATLKAGDNGHQWPVPGHMSGLHLVVGGTSAGKSEWMSRQGADVTVRWGEPAELYDNSESAIQVADIAEALATAFVISGAGFRVVIDSFRNLVFGVTGAAGPGGVSVELYAALTSINNVAAQLGLLLVAGVNPMSEGEKANLVYNNLAASVAGMSTIENSKLIAQTARTVSGRVNNGGFVGADGQNVRTYPLNATNVQDPVLTSPRVRLDSQVVDVPDDLDIAAPRRGGKLAI